MVQGQMTSASGADEPLAMGGEEVVDGVMMQPLSVDFEILPHAPGHRRLVPFPVDAALKLQDGGSGSAEKDGQPVATFQQFLGQPDSIDRTGGAGDGEGKMTAAHAPPFPTKISRSVAAKMITLIQAFMVKKAASSLVRSPVRRSHCS